MVKNAKIVPASQFKAKCLALLDEVAATGQPIVVTKHGKPVAQVVSIRDETETINPLKGSVLYQKDIVSPILGPWEMDQ
ncbi:MAG: type II toxin-antitoxin system Phd/YefM family antitoxin [Pirellulales bacterium]